MRIYQSLTVLMLVRTAYLGKLQQDIGTSKHDLQEGDYDYDKKIVNGIEYGISGKGSQISTNQEQESNVFSLLIG